MTTLVLFVLVIALCVLAIICAAKLGEAKANMRHMEGTAEDVAKALEVERNIRSKSGSAFERLRKNWKR